MFKVMTVQLRALCLFFFVSSTVHAAETMMDYSMMNHSKVESGSSSMTHTMPPTNSAKDKQSSSTLTKLNVAPASGKAREAGFDNNYNMKQTTVEASLIEKCALASRGIIMLDRASWAKCGVDTKELTEKSGMQQHSGH